MQLRQLKEEITQLEKEMAALTDKDLAVRDAWWMQLNHMEDWETLAEEMQQAIQDDGEDDYREWDDPDQVQELVREEMAYVMGRISQREEGRKQARPAGETT